MRGVKLRRLTAALLAVLVSFSLLQADVKPVRATPDLRIGIDKVTWVGYSVWCGLYDLNDEVFEEDITVTAVSSSNKKVLGTKLDKNGGGAPIYIKAKKTGSVTLTVRYKLDNGATGAISQKVTVRKYPKPIRSLEVNGKSIKVSKKKFQCTGIKAKGTKAKVRMKLRKGWKIDYVSAIAYNSKTGKEKVYTVKKSAIKKGKAISFPKKYNTLCIGIDLKNKSGQHLYYDIELNR